MGGFFFGRRGGVKQRGIQNVTTSVEQNEILARCQYFPLNVYMSLKGIHLKPFQASIP